MRSTLDGLNTSLLKRISREGDRMIFWAVFVISCSPRRALEATLPFSLTVKPFETALFLKRMLDVHRGGRHAGARSERASFSSKRDGLN